MSLLHSSVQTKASPSSDLQHWLAAMETVVIDDEALEQQYCECMEELKFGEADLMVRITG